MRTGSKRKGGLVFADHVRHTEAGQAGQMPEWRNRQSTHHVKGRSELPWSYIVPFPLLLIAQHESLRPPIYFIFSFPNMSIQNVVLLNPHS
jgi:hypothetical protein